MFSGGYGRRRDTTIIIKKRDPWSIFCDDLVVDSLGWVKAKLTSLMLVCAELVGQLAITLRKKSRGLCTCEDDRIAQAPNYSEKCKIRSSYHCTSSKAFCCDEYELGIGSGCNKLVATTSAHRNIGAFENISIVRAASTSVRFFSLTRHVVEEFWKDFLMKYAYTFIVFRHYLVANSIPLLLDVSDCYVENPTWYLALRKLMGKLGVSILCLKKRYPYFFH
ncbi:hypothetical protein Tco_1502512 [Tanacetum coccineum]